MHFGLPSFSDSYAIFSHFVYSSNWSPFAHPSFTHEQPFGSFQNWNMSTRPL